MISLFRFYFDLRYLLKKKKKVLWEGGVFFFSKTSKGDHFSDFILFRDTCFIKRASRRLVLFLFSWKGSSSVLLSMFFFRMAAQRQSKVVETVQERPSLAFAFATGSLFTVYYLWVVVKVSIPICQDHWFHRIKTQCNMTCIINFMVDRSGQYFNNLNW